MTIDMITKEISKRVNNETDEYIVKTVSAELGNIQFEVNAKKIADALRKQIPKKPTIKGMNDLGELRKLCPVCHCEFDDDNNYCGVCGQRLESEPQVGCKDGVCEIDWGEEK